MRINNIIFDLGGVLIDWNPLYVFESLIPDQKKRDFFFNHICTHDWNIEQDAGRLISEATRTKIAEFPEWKEYIEAFYGRWEEMLGGPIHGTVKILKDLKAKNEHHILALTNWSAETFPVALERYKFLQLFEGILVSGEEKMKKPDAEIYDLMLSRYKLKAASTLFIDDNKANVIGARAVGMHAIQFVSSAKLKNDLDSILKERLY